MARQRLIFDNDEAAHAFHRDVGQGAMICVGALRAAHCDELALLLQDHAEWLADQYFEHFRERLTPIGSHPATRPSSPSVQGEGTVVITGSGAGPGLSGAAGPENQTTGADAPSGNAGVKCSAAEKPSTDKLTTSAPAQSSPPPTKPKRRKGDKAPAVPPETAAAVPEADIEQQAIVFSEGKLPALRKLLAAMTCGTKEGQRHIQLARKAVGFTGFIPDASEDEVRKMAKEVKLMELRTKKFESQAPPRAVPG